MTLPLPGPPLEDRNAQEKFDTISREWPSQPGLRVVAGSVTGAGAIGAIFPSGAYTVTRTALGTYAVVFVPTYISAPVIVHSLGIANVNKITRLTARAATGFTLNVRESLAAANSFDEPFDFVAYGI